MNHNVNDAFFPALYRDYRGLKKRITAIRRAHQVATHSHDQDDEPILSPTSVHGRSPSDSGSVYSRTIAHSDAGPMDIPRPSGHQDTTRPNTQHVTVLARSDAQDGFVSEPDNLDYMADHESASRPPLGAGANTTPHPRAYRARSGTVATMLGRALQRANSTKGSGPHQPRFDMRRSIPLMELLPQLTPVERAFFEKLDQELDKVESFYCERERMMRHR